MLSVFLTNLLDKLNHFLSTHSKMFKLEKKNQPIYLESLSIAGIKCFGPEQTIQFSDNGKPKMWTMILGDNGTGKTTILKSIALALSQSLDEPDSKFIDEYEFIRNNFKIKGVVILKTINSNDFGDYYGGSHKPDIKVYLPGIDIREAKIPIFGYGSYRRLGTKGLSNGELPFQFASLFDESAELINAEDWLLRADYEDAKSNQSNKKIERVKNILLKILREEVSDIRIKKGNFGYGVEFKTRYGWVKLKNLSTGYKSLITWMVDLANWLDIYYPDSENPLNEQAIVLIDEIDLHLHVSLQRELVSFLRETFPKIQFIVTAHSPLVVQGSEDENIIVLEKEKDHVVIKSNPLNVKNWRVDQILTSDLFGLESSRSKRTEVKMNRRYELLKKDSLNQKEQEEMKELSNYVQEVPVNDNPELDEASKIIQDAANVLKELKKSKPNV